MQEKGEELRTPCWQSDSDMVHAEERTTSRLGATAYQADDPWENKSLIKEPYPFFNEGSLLQKGNDDTNQSTASSSKSRADIAS